MADRPTPTLTVVMPAYNEAGAIREVVTGWDCQLAALGVPYEIRVYDDGSRDGTGDLLAALARERPALTAVRQPNRGHGPTILRGYREARGEWVFQTDSDGEMGPESFPLVWERRHEADLVLGYRSRRTGASSIARLKLLRAAALSFLQTVRVALSRPAR